MRFFLDIHFNSAPLTEVGRCPVWEIVLARIEEPHLDEPAGGPLLPPLRQSYRVAAPSGCLLVGDGFLVLVDCFGRVYIIRSRLNLRAVLTDDNCRGHGRTAPPNLRSGGRRHG